MPNGLHRHKRRTVPARRTLLGWAGINRACSHDFPDDRDHRLVLHHDHLVDYARDQLRKCQKTKGFSAADFSLKWMLFLDALKGITFTPKWICNHCNEQDGALKAAAHQKAGWYLPRYVSLEAYQLQRLYDIKKNLMLVSTRGDALKIMRDEAVPIVAARIAAVEKSKVQIDAIAATI